MPTKNKKKNKKKNKSQHKPNGNSNNVPYWQEKPFVPLKSIHDIDPKVFGTVLSLDLLPEEAIDYNKLGFTPKDAPTIVRLTRATELHLSDTQYHLFELLKSFKLSDPELIKKLVPLWNATEDDAMESGCDLEEYDDTYFYEDLFQLFMEFDGAAVVEVIGPFLEDPSSGLSVKGYLCEMIENITHKPEYSHVIPKAKEHLMNALQHYEDFDPDVNAQIAFALGGLKATECIPLVQKIFSEDLIDETMCGTYEEFLKVVGAEIDPTDPLVHICKHCNLPRIVHEENFQRKTQQLYAKSLEAAKQFMKDSKYEQALSQLQICLSTIDQMTRDEEKLCLVLGECLIKLERHNEAICVLSVPFHMSTIDEFPPKTEAAWKAVSPFLQLRAIAFEKVGKLKEAWNDIKKAADNDPSVSEDLVKQYENKFLQSITQAMLQPFQSIYQFQAQQANKQNSNNTQQQQEPPSLSETLANLRRQRYESIKLSPTRPILAREVAASCCESFEERKDMFVSPEAIVYSDSCHNVTVLKYGPNNTNKTGKKSSSRNGIEEFGIDQDFVEKTYAYGDYVATASSGSYEVKIFKHSHGYDTPIANLHGHENRVTCIRMNQDIVITASWDKTIRVWRIADEREILTVYGHNRTLYNLEFDTTTNTMITAAGDNLIKEFELTKGQWLRSFVIPKDIYSKTKYSHLYINNINSKYITPKPKDENANSVADKIAIWNVKMNQDYVLCATSNHFVVLFHRPSTEIIHVINTFDHSYTISLCSDSFVFSTIHKLYIADIGTGKIMESLPVEEISCSYYDENKKLLMVGSWDTICVFTLETKKVSSEDKTQPAAAPAPATPMSSLKELQSNLELKRCASCSKIEDSKGQFKLCGRCKKPAYCSVECQKDHWKVHKLECASKSK